jgi:hypothetical protein
LVFLVSLLPFRILIVSEIKDMPHSFSHSGDICKMHLVTFGGFVNLDTCNKFYVCMDMSMSLNFT